MLTHQSFERLLLSTSTVTPNGRDHRRQTPGVTLDVTRFEHENVCTQLDRIEVRIARLESELQKQRACIEALERRARPRTPKKVA